MQLFMTTRVPTLSRRKVLEGALKGSVLLALPVLQLACGKKELVCSDTAGLTQDEIKMRKTLEYVDSTADPAKNCANCQLYKAASADQCGACTLLKGTIHPKGFCKSWAAKTA